MTTITQGAVGSYIFSANESATITLDPSESARVVVTSASGAQKFGSTVSGTRTIGPFSAGDVLSITAIRGSVDYTVTVADYDTPARLAGRPTTRGRRVMMVGGSETARGFDTKNTQTAGDVVFDAANQLITVKLATHNMHTGAKVFLAAEDAIAPFLSGVTVVDNGFSMGAITVVDANTFTLPYWSMLPAGSPYLLLNGSNTLAFSVHKLQQYSATSKFNELNRWLNHPFGLVGSVATGSNNTMNMVERVPALAEMARQGLYDEIRGSLNIGNTLLYGSNHSWTAQQIVDQVVKDVTTLTSAVAPYGIVTIIELTVAQLNSTGLTVAGTMQVIEAIRQLANDTSLRILLEDEFTQSADPLTGLARTWTQLNGTDNVHPSNEGCVYYSAMHAQIAKPGAGFNVQRLAVNVLDNYKSDATSLQLFDPLLSTTPMVNSATLDARASGNVPEVVRAVSCQNGAGRSMVFTYERIGGVWNIVCTITAAAANDRFLITLANPAGVRGIETLMTTIASTVKATYFAGCDFGFVPITGNWGAIGTYFGASMTYGAVTALSGYLSSDSSNDTANADGPMSGPRMGPAIMPTFTVEKGTSVSAAGINFLAAASGAGTAQLRIALPTLRRIAAS